jgi:hypothetical protein
MLCSSIVLYLLDHEKKTAEKIIDDNEIDYNNKGRGVFRALCCSAMILIGTTDRT